jgi:hypothetical protein
VCETLHGLPVRQLLGQIDVVQTAHVRIVSHSPVRFAPPVGVADLGTTRQRSERG